MPKLKALYTAVKGDFLLPPNYPGHEHKWVALDAGLNICECCGAEHICFKGHCPTVQMDHSETVCSISGCIILLSEMRTEWGALDRVHSLPPPVGATKKAQPHQIVRAAMRADTIHDVVEMVVRELLDSPKTARCFQEERNRDQTRKHACLAKLIRDMAHTLQRPNMLHLEAQLAWHCRKCRLAMPASPLQRFRCLCPLTVCLFQGEKEVVQRVIRICVDNICNLIQNHGWQRVDRQLQHSSRSREFICSMLYLMRMGITFKNQTILQKMEILNSLLPLQVFLPTIFNIRAKSITEGENIIKLDLQHIPL